MINSVKRGFVFAGIILFSCINAFTQQIDLREIDTEFQRIDTNRDGFVKSEEMQAYQENRFRELDKDKSGAIDIKELEADKTKMFEKADKDKDGKISQKEAFAQFNEYLNEMDSDKNGKVSEKEFKEYWPVIVKF